MDTGNYGRKLVKVRALRQVAKPTGGIAQVGDEFFLAENFAYAGISSRLLELVVGDAPTDPGDDDDHDCGD